MDVETIYDGYGNTIGVICKNRPAGERSATAVDLETVTRVVLKVGDTDIDYDDDNNYFDWESESLETGEVAISLGGAGLDDGNYTAWLITYDPANEDGIVWGSFPLKVVTPG